MILWIVFALFLVLPLLFLSGHGAFLIGGYNTTHCKMTEYASQAQDPEIKKLFQDAADSAMKNKQELMRFL